MRWSKNWGISKLAMRMLQGGGFGDLLRCVRGCLCGDLDAGNIHRIA